MIDNGLTKTWKGRDGHRWVTFREGGDGPFNFTIRLWRGWLPVWFYVAVQNEFTGRWHRAYGGRP